MKNVIKALVATLVIASQALALPVPNVAHPVRTGTFDGNAARRVLYVFNHADRGPFSQADVDTAMLTFHDELYLMAVGAANPSPGGAFGFGAVPNFAVNPDMVHVFASTRTVTAGASRDGGCTGSFGNSIELKSGTTFANLKVDKYGSPFPFSTSTPTNATLQFLGFPVYDPSVFRTGACGATPTGAFRSQSVFGVPASTVVGSSATVSTGPTVAVQSTFGIPNGDPVIVDENTVTASGAAPKLGRYTISIDAARLNGMSSADKRYYIRKAVLYLNGTGVCNAPGQHGIRQAQRHTNAIQQIDAEDLKATLDCKDSDLAVSGCDVCGFVDGDCAWPIP